MSIINYSGTTRAASFAHGTVTIGGPITVSATGDRGNLEGEDVNISTGALAVGFTLTIATSSRNATEAELGGSVTTTDTVDVESNATNHCDGVPHPEGVTVGLAAIAAMIPIATVSGPHHRPDLWDRWRVQGSTTVHAIGENCTPTPKSTSLASPVRVSLWASHGRPFTTAQTCRRR